MAFSVLSWNVEFFGSRRPGESSQTIQNRIERVFAELAKPGIRADIITIYEAKGAQVIGAAQTTFPAYSWHISDGVGSQQILVGSRLPRTFVTSRAEFSRGFNGPLRPGMLLSVDHNGDQYSLLFLHLKAAGIPIDFGVRSDQHQKVRSLRRALDNGSPGGQARFIVAGDFNSVGLDLSFSPADISTAEENARLAAMYGSRFDDMPLRTKTHAVTFWNGPGSSDPPVDIDHVVAASNVQFAPVGGAEVEVKGWPELATPGQQGDWIRRFSDHAILRFTVN